MIKRLRPSNRIRREIIVRAIPLVQATEKGREIVIDPPEQWTDGSFILLRRVEYLRATVAYKVEGEELRGMVKEVAWASGFDPGRCRAYELVMMRYYLILRHYKAGIRQARKLPRQKRPAQKRTVPELVLSG